MKVGFAGAGNMAAAMARGWAGADGGPEQMLFCDVEPEKATALAIEVGGEAVAGLPELIVRSQLQLLGRVVDLDDSLFDPATAVMSSTPAYFALVAEAVAEAGANHGLEPELAASLTAETLAGTGAMLREHDADRLRRAVAS